MAKTEPHSRQRGGRAARALQGTEPETIDLPLGQSAYDVEELRRRVLARLSRPAAPPAAVCPACGRELG